MSFIKLTDLDLKGKRVLIRSDLNVPVKNGKVTSDARISASMPTFEHCIKAGAKVMVMSHLGRPEEGVFSGLGDIGDSLVKTAEGVMADHRHPLIQCFAAFCTTLEKVAELRAARDEIADYQMKAEHFITKGAGLIPKSGAGPSN